MMVGEACHKTQAEQHFRHREGYPRHLRRLSVSWLQEEGGH